MAGMAVMVVAEVEVVVAARTDEKWPYNSLGGGEKGESRDIFIFLLNLLSQIT